MTIRRTVAVLGVGAALLAACSTGDSGATAGSQAALAPLPTVAGVGVLPVAVERQEPVVVVQRPVNAKGVTAELIGQATDGNRLLMIGDSILASTATRYTGYMCDALVPLGWAVDVEAEPSRFIDFGNRVLDKALPVSGTKTAQQPDWDAAAVFLGSNYGSDQVRYEAELRMILTRLAPRPTLLYTVTEYRPAWAQVNETVRKLAGEFPNVTVIDWQTLAKGKGVLSADRLHPTDNGRHLLVDTTAAALGPAAVGPGQCLKSSFTDDSAVGRGSSSAPASQPRAGGSSTSKGAGTPTTTAKSEGSGGAGGSVTTTTRPPTGGGAASTTAPTSSTPPSTTPSTVPVTTQPSTTKPTTTSPPPPATTSSPTVPPTTAAAAQPPGGP